MIAHDGTHVSPDHGAPTLREIAIGLGRQPRFCGQTREWYPVLSHSLVVAFLTPEEWRPQALLHDAHEAVLGDTVTTWKTPERHTLENRLQARIYERLGLAYPTVAGTAAIKEADLQALAAEAHVLGHARADEHWPRDKVNEYALQMTTDQLGNCYRYLNAHHATNVLEVAFAFALSDRDAHRLSVGA